MPRKKKVVDSENEESKEIDFGRSKLVEINLKLSANQLRKLRKGQSVRVPHTSIAVEGHLFYVKPQTARGLMTAKGKHRGKQIQLSEHEMKASGIFDKIKKGFQKVGQEISKGYKEHVKDTPVGEVIRKSVKEGVSKAIKAMPAIASTVLSGIPGGSTVAPVVNMALSKVADKYSDKAGEKLVEKTGLGIKQDIKKAVRSIKKVYDSNIKNTEMGDKIRDYAKQAVRGAIHHVADRSGSDTLRSMSDNYGSRVADSLVSRSGLGLRSDLKKAFHSTRDYVGGEIGVYPALKPGLLSFDHPTQHPPLPMRDMSGSGMFRHHQKHGGSFLPPGY